MNRVTLIGNLAKDTQVSKTGTGISVCQFVLAVSKRYDREAAPDYINCVAWRQSADYIGQYGNKGDTVAVDGRLQTRSYEAQDGSKRYVTEVIADEVNIVRKKAAQPQQAPAAQQQAAPDPEPAAEPDNYIEIGEDDLPF